MVEFSIGNQRYSVTRPKLRKWLSIEQLRSDIKSADDGDQFATSLFAYLSALLDIQPEPLEDVPWYEVIDGYYFSSLELYPRLDLSILLSAKKKDNKLPDPWEYDERIWYTFVHLFAKNYGWSVEYVEELDVDDAYALVQEISLEDQFEKEWQWSLSEIGYEYDKSTKKSTLRKLPRPDWMMTGNLHFKEAVEKPRPKRRPMRQDFIPPGVVLYDEPKDENKANNIAGSSNTS